MSKHSGVSVKSSDAKSKSFSSKFVLKVIFFLLIIGFMKCSAEIMQRLSPKFLPSTGKVHLS